MYVYSTSDKRTNLYPLLAPQEISGIAITDVPSGAPGGWMWGSKRFMVDGKVVGVYDEEFKEGEANRDQILGTGAPKGT